METTGKLRPIHLRMIQLIYFLDSFALTLVFPIFAKLIIGEGFGKELISFSPNIRPLFLGIAILAFPLAQYLGIFALAKWKFQTHIKFWQLGTLFLMFVGFILSSVSIYFNLFILLVVSRVLTGLGASNYIIGHCIAEELKCDRNRPIRLNLFLLMLSGLIVGVSVGGFFSNPRLTRIFSSETPFIFGAVFSLFVWILTWFAKFKVKTETIDRLCQCIYPNQIIAHLREPSIRFFIAIFALNLISWFAILQFLSAFLVIEYEASHSIITFSLISMGVFFFISFFLFYPSLQRALRHTKLFLIFTLSGSSLFLLLLSFSTDIWVCLIFHTIFAGYIALIWRRSSEEIDHNIHEFHLTFTGLKQVLLLISAIIAPIIASPLCVINPWSIYYFSLLMNIIALLLSLLLV